MTSLIPNRFLFDLEFSLARRAIPVVIDGDLREWTDEYLLPRWGQLDGQSDFGDVWASWNDDGLFIACRVENKRKPLRCDSKSFWTSDHLRLCTDMRDARTNRRANRFCQQFYLLPTGGSSKKDLPMAGSTPIRQARENAPVVAPGEIQVASCIHPNSYTMEAHIPARCLSGFDPAEHARIGFYYMLEDSEHGQQSLTIGDDLYWFVDPSTWATAVLHR